MSEANEIVQNRDLGDETEVREAGGGAGVDTPEVSDLHETPEKGGEAVE